MSALEWLTAELFLNNSLPTLMIIVGSIFFIMIFILFYVAKSRLKWGILSSLLVIGLAISGYSYWRVQSFSAFNELAKNQSVGIRDRRKKPFTYDYFSKQPALEIDMAKLDKLPFYKSSPVIDQESLTFLGKTQHIYYFKIYKKLYNLNLTSENIRFDSAVKSPERRGKLYTLTDLDYQEIGFYQEIGPIYNELVIPKEMEDLEYVDLDERSEPLKF